MSLKTVRITGKLYNPDGAPESNVEGFIHRRLLCPKGFLERGSHCVKPAGIYGRSGRAWHDNYCLVM